MRMEMHKLVQSPTCGTLKSPSALHIVCEASTLREVRVLYLIVSQNKTENAEEDKHY